MTPGKLREKIRNALRKIWRDTRQKEFVQSVTDDDHVVCEQCDKRMWVAEKAHKIKKDGTRTKASTLVYEVDHIDGLGSFTDLGDLGYWAEALFNGDLQILCRECHSSKTRGKK